MNQGESLARQETVVNGAMEHEPTDWTSIDWKTTTATVKRLRQRIFRASQDGDLKKVRSLQKLMLRSYSNRLVSVRRVAQENAGSKTAGVDGVVATTPKSRERLADELSTFSPWRAHPARRVYIPKKNGQQRPLGIPVIQDRALQALVKNALEPYWEAKFERTSYGFRPGRSCHDAIGRIYLLSRPTGKRKWIIDADIKGAFDNIGHMYLLNAMGNFPARELVKQWLKAGYMENGILHPTDAGTPQGGVISPLLANIALHGMEKAIGVKYNSEGTTKSPRAVVRYADDFVVFCETKQMAVQTQEELKQWLADRGLQLSEEKTRIVHITEGFDFLGFNVRQYKVGNTRTGYRLLIKPSRESVQKMRDRLRADWKRLEGAPIAAVLKYFNPVVRGWANYFRIGVASKTFQGLDRMMFKRQIRFVNKRHPHKPAKWKRPRYWGKLHPEREDRWVFGDMQKGSHLLKFSWFPIERHILVVDTASPDDPGLKDYWAKRALKKTKVTIPSKEKLARRQRGICPVCKEPLFNGEWERPLQNSSEKIHVHHRTPRAKGGKDNYGNLELQHLHCHQSTHAELRRHDKQVAQVAPEDDIL